MAPCRTRRPAPDFGYAGVEVLGATRDPAVVDGARRCGFDRGMPPTPTQQAYIDFIRKYVDLHRRSPAEAEMQAFFGVTPPTVHQMVVTLTEKGFISREPGKPRSICLVAQPHATPSRRSRTTGAPRARRTTSPRRSIPPSRRSSTR
jgi:hypothetical protein